MGSRGLRVAIDANSIRAGGGLGHLCGFLDAADPPRHGVESIEVWAGSDTLSALPERPWLKRQHVRQLDSPSPRNYLMQALNPPHLKSVCDVVFSPSGWSLRTGAPLVTMAQNMLPFEPGERARYGASWMSVRLQLLKTLQLRSFEASALTIFLTSYSADLIRPLVRGPKPFRIIPHGVDRRFLLPPRPASPVSRSRPLRVLYASAVSPYKHQWLVAEAVASLRSKGVWIDADFIGPAYPPSLTRLRQAMKRFDARGDFLRYQGELPAHEIHKAFHAADVFVFASTCEAFSLILLQAMAAGLPIVCSNRGPMPDLLGPAGLYVDPERPSEIAEAIQRLVDNPVERAERAAAAFQRAQLFSWSKCAAATMSALCEAAEQ